ncbi:hypothetical protein [Stenotrophomonas sp. PS02298]|uniref:hypothetical protein n=1 Tax=Stenotrophomonas sp. PS02298 TaxID=2991424 RepID=UPI00249B6616|nr:hypothetical protein [Stenotrophomonas sp. PS02298]
MFHRPRLLLGVALALGTKLAGNQPIRPPQPAPKPEIKKARRVARSERWSGFLTDRRRWLIRWAPNGGGNRERQRRCRQIAAGTLNRSNGLVPFNRNH